MCLYDCVWYVHVVHAVQGSMRTSGAVMFFLSYFVVGRKREPSTSDDGGHPAAKRRSVSVNVAMVQPEAKSPVKSQWKQVVEHEVQEARKQLTRIKARKCLQLVQAMEADATKQRWVCLQHLWIHTLLSQCGQVNRCGCLD